jgi:lysophospholipase L1-like esterase
MENTSSTKYILAFGDSLTKGYYNHGMKYHPYSLRINKLFEENKLDFKIIDSGVNGEGTKKMLERIKTFFQGEYLPHKFSHVIIYAGANDLGSMSYENIAENIISLNKYVIENGVSSILVTLPQNQCDIMYDFYGEKRVKVNEYLRKVAVDIDKLTICDLDKYISFKSMDKTDREKYWDDHIHYSPLGYDLIGEYIFNTIKKNL